MAKSRAAKTGAGFEAGAVGRCLCGGVEIEIATPVRWAWHDHTRATQKAQGTAVATWLGCWRSRVRVSKGQALISRFEHAGTGTVRSFCAACGTPLIYERTDPQMVNLPRSLFEGRTGREPLYHIGFEQAPEWAYRGEPLGPLKGFPGVLWERPRRKKRQLLDDMF